MIYLIYSLGINTDIKEDCILDSIINGEFNEFEPIKMLKIGYTGDDEKTFKSRFGAYKTQNPGSKILCTISGLTMEDEGGLHDYFRSYLIDGSREWFKMNSDILNLFKKLRESTNPRSILDELGIKREFNYLPYFPGLNKSDSLKIRKELRVYIYKVLISKDYITDSEGADNIITSLFLLGKKETADIDNYIRENFGDIVLKDYESRLTLAIEKFPGLIEKVDLFLGLTKRDKYEFLCTGEFTGYSESKRELFLSFIPDYDIVKSNYIALGPEKLKSLGYNRTLIDIELEKLMINSNNDLTLGILKEFSVKELIPSPIIKSRLSIVYNSFNYKGTPKAVDIKSYFEVRETIVRRDLDGSGTTKAVKAYELLQPKEQYQELYNQVKGV